MCNWGGFWFSGWSSGCKFPREDLDDLKRVSRSDIETEFVAGGEDGN